MSFVSTPPGYDYYEGEDADADEANGNEEGDEEPWLDTPERLRLILGLVAEFTEGEANKIESEVSLDPSPVNEDRYAEHGNSSGSSWYRP